MIVADSDALIDFLRGIVPGADRVAEHLRKGTLATTVITVAELVQGSRSPKQRDAISGLLDGLTVLAFDRTAAERAGDERARLRRDGVDIGLADVAIAAICLTHDLPVLTGNTEHFDRVSGLSVQALR